MIEGKRKELFQMYKQWESEFKKTCPELRCAEYSYPYYLHIPDNWFDSKYRIMIVGEEGSGGTQGDKQFNAPIQDAQKFNEEYLLRQLDKGNARNTDYRWNSSPFWRRLRAIKDLGAAVCWNNIDKVHAIRNGRCNLNKCDRKALHSTKTKILAEEIRILNPTHIVYFGWYGDSLKAELPLIYERLYSTDGKNDYKWKGGTICCENDDSNRWHIFTYHPSWGQRQKGYENLVLEEIEKAMQ